MPGILEVARPASFAVTPAVPAPAMPPIERTATIRLLVVDGHPLVRWALTHIAAEAPDLHTVGEASNAADAMNLARGMEADVVTIDCSLPDGTGWQLARDLRERHPDLGIVMLTSSGSDDLLFRALDSGASAFLCNSASARDVLSAIRHSAVAPSSFNASGLAQAMRRRNQTTDRLVLSGRERQVLALLREGRSVPQVAAELYVSLSTAKTYVARVYDKLGANNRAQALMTAVRLGLFANQHAA